jgi:hypothetical protein
MAAQKRPAQLFEAAQLRSPKDKYMIDAHISWPCYHTLQLWTDQAALLARHDGDVPINDFRAKSLLDYELYVSNIRASVLSLGKTNSCSFLLS